MRDVMAPTHDLFVNANLAPSDRAQVEVQLI